MSIRRPISSLGAAKPHPYKVGTVILDSSVAGTDNLNIKTGIYYLESIGGGGGYGGAGSPDGHYWLAVGTGASGAGFVGIIALNDDIYNYAIGSGGPDARGNLTKGTPGGETHLLSSLGKGIITLGGDAASAVGNNWSKGGGKKGLINITAPEWIKSATLATDGIDGPSICSISGKQKGAPSIYFNYGEGSLKNSDRTANGANGKLKLVYLGQRYISGVTEELVKQYAI